MGFLYARASEETSRTVVIVVLGAEMEGRLLAEPLHAALPRSRPAPPALPRLVVPCLAPTHLARGALPRPALPERFCPWDVRVLDSISVFYDLFEKHEPNRIQNKDPQQPGFQFIR